MLADARLHYVDTLAEATAFIEWVHQLGTGPVSIDTETTGLEWWTPRFVRLVQFGTADEGWALDTERWRGAIEEALRLLVERQNPIIMHNSAFDMHALEGDGYPTPRWIDVHDTMLAHHLVVPHASHALKTMAASYFGPQAYAGQAELKAKAKELGFGGQTYWALIDTREPAYWVYAVMDTILTFRCAQLIFAELRQAGLTPLYEREMAVRAIHYRGEKRGLRIDRDWASDLRTSWTHEAVRLADQLEAAGVENPRSNQQVSAVLEGLDWEPDEFTPTGAAKLDKVILAQLSQHPSFGPVAVPLLRYRRITKWISAYLDPFLDRADADGRVHHSIRVLQARTGRDSITGPPMQTLPARDDGAWMIRRCILPDDGNSIWTVDYNSQEARLFAHYSRDPGMLAALAAGEDLYTYTARIIYGDPTITKSDDRRTLTKVNMLAFLYGAGIDKLAKTSGLSHDDTRAFIMRLFESFPNVRELTGDHAIGGSYPGGPATVARQRGAVEGLRYVLTKSGRRFSVPNDDELYKCVNGLMQGSGADVLKDAIIRLDQVGLADNIVLPVHDELVFQFPMGHDGEYAAREAASLMEDHELSVPITTELKGPFDSWGVPYMPEELL